jgi:hypothetical protein
MSLNTDGLPIINPNKLTGFESGAFDTYMPAGEQPQSIRLTLAAILFAAVAGAATAVTASAGAATTTATKVTLTTDSLTLAYGQTYTLTVTDSAATATNRVYAQLRNGTNTAQIRLDEPNTAAYIQSITVATGSIVFVIGNASLDNVLNGTCILDYVVL